MTCNPSCDHKPIELLLGKWFTRSKIFSSFYHTGIMEYYQGGCIGTACLLADNTTQHCTVIGYRPQEMCKGKEF